MGGLYPIGLTEAIPGDMFSHNTSIFLRCSPLARPVMHRVSMRVHHFFIPHRIVWPGFENFYTGGPDNDDATTAPFVTLSYTAGTPDTGTGIVGSLADHLGTGVKVNNFVTSALPFRGYNMVYNYFYRDQDLQDEAVINTGNGSDATTELTLRNVCWEKDYYTTARPWPQKGPDITIPIGTTAPITGMGLYSTGVTATGSVAARESSPLPNRTYAFGAQGPGVGYVLEVDGASGAGQKPKVYADLSNASAITIQALREASALQIIGEKRARWGSRYDEVVANQFGVKIQDSRLQQPEYLGGGQAVVQFSEVVQTANDTDDPVGQLYGHGIAAGRSNRYVKFFPEHGFVLSLLSVRPRTVYMQGVPRHWWRPNREDYFQPELAAIGQQTIRNQEVYAPHATPNGTFGYSNRYQEYRGNENRVSGEFRTLLKDWHLAREFTSTPALNEDFVECIPREDIFADNQEDVLYVKAMHQIRALRAVPASASSRLF